VGGEIGGQFLDEEPAPLDTGFNLDEAPPPPAPVVTTGLRAQAAAAPADATLGVPADLRRALDEIESYVSMGFVDDARNVLAEAAARFSAYPALVQRLAELGLEVEAPSEMDALLGQTAAAAEPEAGAEEPLQLGEGFLEFTPSTTLPTAPAAPAPAAGGDGEGFDLASELGGLFGAQAAVAEDEAAPTVSTDLGDASLADIFREFQKGVDKQLGKEDYETRYNLGIAYKEMGLVDEAIAEFQLAAKDEARLLECASMLGICFIEKGMPKLAVKWFEKGLQAPGRSEEEYQGLRYDLASALEQAGESGRALALFTELYGQDASFRDVADKVRQLGG
jgi:tetratricopeptide (TPR) repeat protein